MRCPKDNTICERKRLEDVEIDRCPICHGVWLEKVEVRNLTRHFSMPEYSNADDLLKEWETVESKGTTPKDFWQEDKLLCPKEGVQMQKHYFSGSLIGVDQCRVCEGFWFDGGELQAIAKYTEPSPEIDKAWQMFVKANDGVLRRRLANMRPADPRVGGSSPSSFMIGQMHPVFAMGYMITRHIVDYLHKSY